MSRPAIAPPAAQSIVRWLTAASEPPAAGVEAGTLLGLGGRAAADLAGDGTIAIARPGDRVELRAGRDGVPAVHEDSVTIDRAHEIAGDADRACGDRSVCGSLRVGGHVGPGRELNATGPLRVEGLIDRAVVRAGGELTVDGRAHGAVLVGGAMSALRRRLHDPLQGLAGDIDGLLAMTAQLMGSPRSRGAVDPARAIRALCASRFEHLEPRLARARALLSAAQRDWPGIASGLAAELEAAYRAVRDPEGAADPLADLARASGFLAAAVPERRPLTDAGVRVSAARGCVIDTPGPLRLTGQGAVECEITAGGDLIAMASGGVVRDGSVRVGGRVRVRELSATHGRRMSVVIDDVRADDELLRAGMVTAGVEVTAAGRVIRFDRRCTGVRIVLRDGIPVAETD